MRPKGLKEKIRTSFKWMLLKRKRKRLDKKCTVCGSTENLTVHHIRPLQDIFEQFLKDNPKVLRAKNPMAVADKYAPFFDINNLCTLCNDCHRLEHLKNNDSM